MSSPEAAPRVAAPEVASLAALLSPARAAASRKNGAKSRGPKTPEGKARASRNALRHGMRAEQHVVVEGESAEAFAAFEAALVGELAPVGVLQTLLAGRIVRAAWRLERAERIEAELFARQMEGVLGDGDLGLALIRDGKGARAFDTLLRYRGTAQAEFSRSLRLLQTLQAEAGACRAAERPAADQHETSQTRGSPNEPEARGNPGDSRYTPSLVRAAPGTAAMGPALATTPRGAPAQPDEPDSRKNPRDSSRCAEAGPSRPVQSAPLPRQAAEPVRALLLAGTALASASPGRATADAAGSRC